MGRKIREKQNSIHGKFVLPEDIGFWWMVGIGVLLVAIRIAFVTTQRIYLYPAESGLDDMLMIRGGMSIAKGEWLGAYDWKTLSKHSFFSLWLAGLNKLGIPFLIGGQILWIAASIAAAWAFLPAVKKRIWALCLFAILLFNPAAVANPTPHGFTTRVYRDNIFPALCLLAIVGMAGFALRYNKELKRSIGWLAVAGVGFAAAWLTREDGWWLLPFMLLASAAMALLLVWKKQPGRLAKMLALLLPFVLLVAGDLSWRTMNYKTYGRFIITDFSSGEFADAYGALTRIKHANWDPKVAVPKDVRQQLYKLVPEFAALEEYLECDWYLGRYAGDDYSSGAFYWALREAAGAAGFYENAQVAQEFWAGMAANINRLCDEGVLECGPRRSSVSPPIRADYVVPVLKHTAVNLAFCATFQQYDPASMRSIGDYETEIRPLEEFLHSKALMSAVENSDQPYFTPTQKQSYRLLRWIRHIYAVLGPVLLVLALTWQLLFARKAFASLKGNSEDAFEFIQWLVLLGFLFCILLRAAMIAFVDVSSFSIGTYIMYLATIHPLMIIYGLVGSTLFIARIGGKFKENNRMAR